MHNPSANRCLVFDLDTTLPFPTHFHKYITETFRSDYAVSEDHHRYMAKFNENFIEKNKLFIAGFLE